jgi:hypothetical protein
MEEPGKLLQVLSYALMYSAMQDEPPRQLVSGIISLRKSSSYLVKTDINKSDTLDAGVLQDFTNELELIIGDIFSASQPFIQTANRDTCNMCSFSTICNRTVN